MSRRHISIKTAFAVAFIAVATLPVWLAWQWPQIRAVDLAKRVASENHAVFAGTVATSLERYHTDLGASFELLAVGMGDADGAVTARRAAILDSLGLYSVCQFDLATGALLHDLETEGATCPSPLPQEELELIRSLAEEAQVRFSGVRLDAQGRTVMMLVRREGQTVTVGTLSTAHFRELGGTVRFGTQGHAVIVDQTGRVLSHPMPGKMSPPKDMSGLAVVQMMMAGQEGKADFRSPGFGMEMFAAYRSIEGPGWGVMVPQPVSEIEGYVDEVKKGTLAALLIALVLALLLALLITHRMLDPLKRIRLAAERVGKGTGDALIAPTGAGSWLREIDDLRATFNAMVLRVRASQRTEVAARKDAQEANLFKSRFLANMSHELRTPLNAIIGFAEVTERRLTEPQHERDREYVGYIHESGRHLLSIINDLLDLSRIEAGAWVLNESEVDIGEAVHEAAKMMTTMAQDRDITLTLTPLEADLHLWADERGIKQMLLNLGTNALRYTQKGGTVAIGARRNEAGAISMWISDNGPGIDPDELERIRIPFARGETHEKSAVPGAGLGLSIVDALADMHGARFDLSSTAGEGTTARVTFPPNRGMLTLSDTAG